MIETMPPILLLSDSSANLLYGMLRHPFFEGTHRMLDAIKATGDQNMTLFELDGATGNERLYHHFLSVERYGPMIELIKCRNHQTNLVEGSLILTASPAGNSLLSLLFSFTHFIRTGGHWVRLKQAVKDWIRENAEVHRNHSGLIGDSGWTEHALELKSFLESSDRLQRSIAGLASSTSDSPTAEGQPDGKSKLQQKLDEFFVSWLEASIILCYFFCYLEFIILYYYYITQRGSDDYRCRLRTQVPSKQYQCSNSNVLSMECACMYTQLMTYMTHMIHN